MLLWKSVTYLFHLDCGVYQECPRRERRRLARLARSCRHDRGRRLPALVLLPITWMAMTHVITVPTSSFLSPFYRFEGLGSQLYHFGANAYHCVTYLDELMVLDWVPGYNSTS